MGNIHTPKTIYNDGLVMDFFVKNKEVYYKLSKWNEEGTSQALIESAKLGDQNPIEIMNEVLRLFTKGITE